MKKYNLLIKSITSDNGLVFKALGLFRYQRGIDIYKCNPYASHERESNENANGLISREYPKSTYVIEVSNEDIEILMDNINNMPRKIFNFDSATMKYRKELSSINTKEVMQNVLQKDIEKTPRRHGYLYIKKFEH